MTKPYTRNDDLPRISEREWHEFVRNADHSPGTDEIAENASIVDAWVICPSCQDADEPCDECRGSGGYPVEIRQDWLNAFEFWRKAVVG